jgi:hypothetical protein
MVEDKPHAPFAVRARALRAVNRLNGSFAAQATAERMAGFTAFETLAATAMLVGSPTEGRKS